MAVLAVDSDWVLVVHSEIWLDIWFVNATSMNTIGSVEKLDSKTEIH